MKHGIKCFVFFHNIPAVPDDIVIAHALKRSIELGIIDGWDPDSVLRLFDGKEAMNSDCYIINSEENTPVVMYWNFGDKKPIFCNSHALVCEVF